jgi:hypothetical protein
VPNCWVMFRLHLSAFGAIIGQWWFMRILLREMRMNHHCPGEQPQAANVPQGKSEQFQCWSYPLDSGI